MTDPHNMADRSGELHTGYDLESGFLARVREWTDLLPWLRLVRTLRVAGSPVMVGLVALTLIVWWTVQFRLIASPPELPQTNYESPLIIVQRIAEQTARMLPITVFAPSEEEFNWLGSLLSIGWALIAWTPTTLYLLRQGAILTAGRDLIGLTAGMHRAIRLTPIALLIAIVPLVCVLLFGSIILAIGWFSRWVAGVVFLETLLALIIILPALACGVLGFGAYVAVPLGWAALANERDPDALDSLSRGYEYLYRRPLQVVLYAFLSLVMLLIITAMATMIAQVAAWVSVSMLLTAGTPELLIAAVVSLLSYYPVVVGLTLFWALLGGVYLLLRHDAGQQQVEDLWQPAPKPEPPLPQLPISAEANQ